MAVRAPNDEKLTILYIAGWGRSGTTLMDNILGQVDGFFSVGEIRYIWERSFVENRLCGCGKPFSDCPIWRAILRDAFGAEVNVDVDQMMRSMNRARTRHLPLLWFPQTQGVLRERLRLYLQHLDSLYRSIQSVTGCRVIVDSSKFPSYGYTLGMFSNIDMRVVHLVRDARAVSFSWLRRKPQPDTPHLPHMLTKGSIKSALLWNSWNIAIERFWGQDPERYLRLRYEDFVAHPVNAVMRSLEMVGENCPELSFMSDHEVELMPNHTLSGNPNRFRTGRVPIQIDDEWRDAMSRPRKALVTALTWPVLMRYNYPIRTKRPNAASGRS